MDWIVKNFEQIDGDILQSRGQFEQDAGCGRPIRKTYHFACLSDRDMNRRVNDLLPWPLTEDYLREAYSPVDLPYQVYYTALCERGGFLRYGRCQMMDMFLCPYRYFLDYVVSDAPIIHGQFLYQKYYENILIEAVWKQISLQPTDEAQKTLEGRIRSESGKLRAFFPFWKDTEIYDLEMRAKNYLLHDIIGKSRGCAVRAYAGSHMAMRRLFGKAWFSAELSGAVPVNLYPSFEKMAAVQAPGLWINREKF